jgi:alpha-D-ribose 1-methylphosphonate 5-triphosphate diphosphatase
MLPRDFVLTNARLVTEERVLDGGWMAVVDGVIVEVGEGRAPETGFDVAGDYLIPGLVELHTDHLEPHFNPRPNVFWDPMAAVLAYDGQIAASGITTVFDSLRVGDEFAEKGGTKQRSFATEVLALAEAIETARAAGITRAEHRTHLRCEVCALDVVDAARSFIENHPLDLMSLMDHTPGQRHFRDVEKLMVYWRGKVGQTDEELRAHADRKIAIHHERGGPHRAALVALARDNGIVLASHDDATLSEVDQAVCDGVAIAEFPTTVEAATASHAAGIRVLMGAPNVIRGGSHSGNVAASTLAGAGVLDILSSDYIPSSLIMAAFDLPRRAPNVGLAQAIAMVTRAPALAAGLDDRGVLAPMKRADFVRVGVVEDHPVVREVWRGGTRVV